MAKKFVQLYVLKCCQLLAKEPTYIPPFRRDKKEKTIKKEKIGTYGFEKGMKSQMKCLSDNWLEKF